MEREGERDGEREKERNRDREREEMKTKPFINFELTISISFLGHKSAIPYPILNFKAIFRIYIKKALFFLSKQLLCKSAPYRCNLILKLELNSHTS